MTDYTFDPERQSYKEEAPSMRASLLAMLACAALGGLLGGLIVMWVGR
jgi:hypothetical protein